MDSIKILIIITNRKITDKIAKALEKNGAKFVDIINGKGTVQSEIVSLLGLGEQEKAVLLSSITESKIQTIFDILNTKFNFSTPGNGIAFTIPVSAVGEPATQKLMSGEKGVK